MYKYNIIFLAHHTHTHPHACTHTHMHEHTELMQQGRGKEVGVQKKGDII